MTMHEGRVDDYYAILGLSEQATRPEIKAAYRELAKQHHPDKKNIHKKTFGEMQADLDGRRVSEAADFRMVQAAWETLSDMEKRKEYDSELALFRQEQAKLEKRQAKERAKAEKKAAKEEKERKRKEKREAEAAAREAAIRQLAETKAEEEFLENLYKDFGEDDRPAFELADLKLLLTQRRQASHSDPELDSRESNPELRSAEPRASITCTDPELEDITNGQGASRHSTGKGRRHAEVWSEDPELDPTASPAERITPTTAHLMAEIDKAMKMRLSQPHMNDHAFHAFQDPEIV